MPTINPHATAIAQFFDTNSVSVESNLFELAVEAVRNGDATLVFAGPHAAYHKKASKVLVDIVEGRHTNLYLKGSASIGVTKPLNDAAHAMALDPTGERAAVVGFFSPETYEGVIVISNLT